MRRTSLPAPGPHGSEARSADASPYPYDPEVERQIAAIEAMSLTELRDAWRQRFSKEPPKLKGRDLYVRVLCFQLQADIYGDHSAAVKRKLRDLAARLAKDPKAALFPTPQLKPGIVLTRTWKGVVHRVLVQSEGYLYDGRVYSSLSEVASSITGTRWSGPRFFGIENIIRRQLREGEKRS